MDAQVGQANDCRGGEAREGFVSDLGPYVTSCSCHTTRVEWQGTSSLALVVEDSPTVAETEVYYCRTGCQTECRKRYTSPAHQSRRESPLAPALPAPHSRGG